MTRTQELLLINIGLDCLLSKQGHQVLGPKFEVTYHANTISKTEKRTRGWSPAQRKQAAVRMKHYWKNKNKSKK